MTDDNGAPAPRHNITPSQLPLRKRAALFERLQMGRQRRPPKSWQQLAIEERFAQRTLEHFHKGATELEENADERPDVVIAEEHAGRFIHARATAMAPSRTRVPAVPLPEDFVPPPLRREITPSQLPLGEQAALFARLQEARWRRPARSWKYLAVEQGFSQRTLEHFYKSAMKLEENADKRPLAQIVGELLRARSTAMPVSRRSGGGLGEAGIGAGRAVERRRARTEAGRRARETSAVETERSAARLHDERRAAEAREVERQQRRAQEDLVGVEDAARQAVEERRWEAEEEQLRARDPMRQLMDVWGPDWWGPAPVDGPF